MTDLETNILRVLRIFGPCSNFDVARRIGMRPAKVYPIVKALTDRGFATHSRRQAWDISDHGRAWFEANGINELRLFA